MKFQPWTRSTRHDPGVQGVAAAGARPQGTVLRRRPPARLTTASPSWRRQWIRPPVTRHLRLPSVASLRHALLVTVRATEDGGRRTEDRCWVRMHKAGVLRLERPSCGFVSAGLADYCLIVGYWKDKGQGERGCVACVEDRPSRARRQIICCDPARRVRRCYADGVLRQRPQQCRVEWQ